MDKIKLVVADGNRELCNLVKIYLNLEDKAEFCGAAYDGVSAIDLIREVKPDVVLLDYDIPKLDASGVMKQLWRLDKSVRPKVVTIATIPTNTYVSEMYRLGADDVMLTKNDVEEMVDRCVTVVNEERRMLDDSDVEKMITTAICAIGVPANVKGYTYMRTAIAMVAKERNLVYSITKQLYPEVAKKYATTASKVERNIRNAIEIAWARGNKEALSELFEIAPECMSTRPTNSEFIAMTADKIRMKVQGRYV